MKHKKRQLFAELSHVVQKQAEGPKMRAAEAGAACVPTYWRIWGNKTEATYSPLATACDLRLAHYPKTPKIPFATCRKNG